MKKFLALLLSAVLCFSGVVCGMAESEPQEQTIEITLDNWQDYFEIRRDLSGSINTNAFDELSYVSYSIITTFALKEEFVDNVTYCNVSIEYDADNVPKYIRWNASDFSYEITGDCEELHGSFYDTSNFTRGYTTDLYQCTVYHSSLIDGEIVKTNYSIPYSVEIIGHSTMGTAAYITFDNKDEWLEEREGYMELYPDNINITRIKGTLMLEPSSPEEAAAEPTSTPETESEPAEQTIEITLDNWQDYFEIRRDLSGYLGTNAFDELTGVSYYIYTHFALKEEFAAKVVSCDVAIEYDADNVPKTIAWNAADYTYEITGDYSPDTSSDLCDSNYFARGYISSLDTSNSFNQYLYVDGTVQKNKVHLPWSVSLVGHKYAPSLSDIMLDNDEEWLENREGYMLYYPDNINITRIKGTLVLDLSIPDVQETAAPTAAPTAEPEVPSVEITLDNWQEYFEIRRDLESRIHTNDFDEITSVSYQINTHFALKEEFADSVESCDVAIEYDADNAPKYIRWNASDLTYEITGDYTDSNGELYDSAYFTRGATTKLNSSNFLYLYTLVDGAVEQSCVDLPWSVSLVGHQHAVSCSYIMFDNDEEWLENREGYMPFYPVNINITRIKGTLVMTPPADAQETPAPTAEPEDQVVELTVDNWQDYFEFRQYFSLNTNAEMPDVGGFFYSVLVPKDEFADHIVSSDVVIRYDADNVPKWIEWNPDDLSYAFTGDYADAADIYYEPVKDVETILYDTCSFRQFEIVDGESVKNTINLHHACFIPNGSDLVYNDGNAGATKGYVHDYYENIVFTCFDGTLVLDGTVSLPEDTRADDTPEEPEQVAEPDDIAESDDIPEEPEQVANAPEDAASDDPVIEITLDNWQDYFEIRREVGCYIVGNGSDDDTRISDYFYTFFALKQEYADRVTACDVAIEYNADNAPKFITWNATDFSFDITGEYPDSSADCYDSAHFIQGAAATLSADNSLPRHSMIDGTLDCSTLQLPWSACITGHENVSDCARIYCENATGWQETREGFIDYYPDSISITYIEGTLELE